MINSPSNKTLARFLISVLVLSSTPASICKAQSKPSLKRSFQGRPMSIEEFISNPEVLKQRRDEYLRRADPMNRLSRLEHENLWKQNIQLDLHYKSLLAPSGTIKGASTNSVNSTNAPPLPSLTKVKIDRFGLSATALIYEQRPMLCADVMKQVADEIEGRSLSFRQIVELILNLKQRIDLEWGNVAPEEFPVVVFRSKLVEVESKVRNAKECWLLVDVYHSEQKSEDIIESDFRNINLGRKMAMVDSKDERTFINHFLPHPQAEESVHWLTNQPKLEASREKPIVTVQDDGLTHRQRESDVGFHVIDETGRKTHQIEGRFWDSVDNDPRKEFAIEEATRLLSERIPNGSVVSKDELHLRIGNAAKELSGRFPNYKLTVTISNREVGQWAYSGLNLQLQSR